MHQPSPLTFKALGQPKPQASLLKQSRGHGPWGCTRKTACFAVLPFPLDEFSCFFDAEEWIPNNIKASVCDIPPKARASYTISDIHRIDVSA